MKLFSFLSKQKKSKNTIEKNPQKQLTPPTPKQPDTKPIENARKKAETNQNNHPKEKRIDGFSLGKEQSIIIDIIENSTENYFITGKAGSGKSTILKYFIQHTAKQNCAVVAPTGIAALNVEGQTIHSFFKLDFGFQDTSKIRVEKDGTKEDAVLSHLDVLIIDEISMVRADIMDMIDKKLQVAKKSEEAFGGCQVIAFGDLYQLPPVVKEKVENDLLIKRYGTVFFFGSPGVKKTFTTIELQEVYRQREPFFISILNKVREGNINESEILYLNTASGTEDKPELCTTLVLTNKAAELINNEKLNRLTSDELEYHAVFDGEYYPSDDTPCEKTIRLRVGAQVMLIKNNREQHYVNGTLAIVKKLDKEHIWLEFNKKTILLDKETWSKYKYEYDKEEDEIIQIEIGHFTQYPIKLAYAMTIHKSQGRTFDDICIDYMGQNAFSSGQTYVALSRCKSLEHMHIVSPIKMTDISTNPEIIHFMKNAITPEKAQNARFSYT